jgi:N-methylhydantoinase B/oxoprolinase/acetone carboxylase alpha subunit
MIAKPTLDPVTFEVLKNSFITGVDQMGEQILRTCYSFVIYTIFPAPCTMPTAIRRLRAIRTSLSMSARCISPARL